MLDLGACSAQLFLNKVGILASYAPFFLVAVHAVLYGGTRHTGPFGNEVSVLANRAALSSALQTVLEHIPAGNTNSL